MKVKRVVRLELLAYPVHGKFQRVPTLIFKLEGAFINRGTQPLNFLTLSR
jgi:hypothetical protein